MSSQPEIILMARWPAASRCKKRLSKKIGIAQAANIQRQLTIHTVSVANCLMEKGLADVCLSISGLGPKASQRWANTMGVKKIAIQGSGSLGLRMKRELKRTQKTPHSLLNKKTAAILIGTDLPGLCQLDLIEALDALKKYPLVLGPSKDGGYWLIGLAKELLNPLANWPFCGIPWGTKEVLNITLEKAREKNISFHLLRQQNDIDNLEDLNPWIK